MRMHPGPGRSGMVAIPGAADIIAAWQAMSGGVNYALDGFARLGGASFPTTTRLDRLSGEAMGRRAGAKVFAQLAAEHYADKVLGNNPPDFDLFAGQVITERRLQFMKQAYQSLAKQGLAAAAHYRAQATAARTATRTAKRAGNVAGQIWNEEQAKRHAASASAEARRAKEAARAAAGVTTTLIPANPLKVQSDYNAAMAFPAMQDVINRWNADFVPVQEALGKKARGLEPTDPIHSFTQVPGSPMNLKPVRPGEAASKSHASTGGGKGNLRNVQFRRLGTTLQAHGNAAAYDISLRKIIEKTLVDAADLAAKADAARIMERAMLGAWGRAGSIEINGEKFPEVPFTRPPKGTQANTSERDTFHVHPKAHEEWLRADSFDRVEPYQKVFAALATVPTVGSLASAVEAITHTLNLGGALFLPGVHLNDVIRGVRNRTKNDPDFKAALVRLAKINAVKPRGLESGSFVDLANKVIGLAGHQVPEHVTIRGRQVQTKNLDPTHWGGKWLDAFSDVMRISMDKAFDRLVKRGLVKDTETNRRDFINKNLGQYNEGPMNGALRWVRRTGLGPFAVAGTTMTLRAMRLLTGGIGIPAASWGAAAQLRAEALGRLAVVLGSTFALNYAWWGRWDGDDQTPFGELKIGVDKNGKTVSWPTPASIFRRGLRAVGLLAIIEGARQGKMPGEIADRAAKDMMHSAFHPLLGPAYQLAHTAATGENAIGMHVAGKAKKGESQIFQYNVPAAAGNLNPMVANLTGLDNPSKEQTEWYEKVMKLAGPLAPKTHGPPKKK